MRLARLGGAVLGAPVVSSSWLRFSESRVRVVAYHDVPDEAAFREQVIYLQRAYRLVTGADVAEALSGRARLPKRALWLTFDDGAVSVIERALPLLCERSIPATLFVCPGLVTGSGEYWWDVVEAHGRLPRASTNGADITSTWTSVRELKNVDDVERRRIVATLRSQLGDEWTPPRRSAHLGELRTWVAAGLEVGNHTWDHPCLDRCEPVEQCDQIRRAHEWLARELGVTPTLFAYPNGDWTPDAEAELLRLRYRVAALFDHRIGAHRPDSLRLSRLRLSTDDDLPRVRAIASGVNPALFHLLRRADSRRRELPGRSVG